ncbi:MAG TPA: adenylosuccinate lyase [Terriglobia bacterium]|jgi:adenylosuccinate lyase|nr:adenylosuccinate lyase [Terriglobia bacterium]
MIPRYTRPEMGRIWSDENKFRCWLAVEIAAAEVEAEAGLIPKSAARDIRRKGKFSVERIVEIEERVKHDVIAFTTNVAENIGPSGRYLHFGLTSNDVVDTAQALQVREASELLRAGLERLGEVLKKRALEFKHTPMVGRTHGIHAEPITFGWKIAIWYAENRRNLERFRLAAEQMRVGKISGAVGTYAHLSPQLEARICARLGLEPAPIASQVIQRDRHAFYLTTLAVIASSLDKIALEVRGLQRTEVREVEEYFGAGQKGSSAMPHKRNPVTAEQICGLARVVRSNAQAALENVALWHERDISHSSVERVILPDSTILVDYLLHKTARLVETLFVYPERMQENLNLLRGLIFSGQLLLDLVEKGALREDAYGWVQRSATQVWQTREDFRTLVERDPDISRHLTPREIARAFSLERQLRHVNTVFRRVFGR